MSINNVIGTNMEVNKSLNRNSNSFNFHQTADTEKMATLSRGNHHLPILAATNIPPGSNLKAASSSANTLKVMNAPQTDSTPLSPLPHHGQRPSLAGFDPLLTPGAPSTSSYSHLSTSIGGTTMNLHIVRDSSGSASSHRPVLSSPPSPHVTTMAAESGKKQSFLLQQTAITQNNVYPFPSQISENPPTRSTSLPKQAESSEKVANKNYGRDSSPTTAGENDKDYRQPNSPSKSLVSPVQRVEKSALSVGMEPTKTFFRKEESLKSGNRSSSPKSPHKIVRDRRTRQPSPAGRKLPSFLRNKGGGHRRTKSLESDDNAKEIEKEVTPPHQSHHRASLPNSPSSAPVAVHSNVVDTKTSIMQELMDLKDKFSALQIPSLAKPSPTSFLTGRGDEAVRTSEYEPSPFQMEIPSLPEVVETARLNDFVENYRRMDQNFDLTEFVGYSRTDLEQVKLPGHIPIAQSLLECGDGLTIQGFISKGTHSDERLEAVVVEGQRQFTMVFRGTTEQQTKLMGNNSKYKKRAVPLDAEEENVEVYCGFKEEYTKLEHECFSLIDKLSEQNPFCDFIFTGYSFGAAMATLAAYRYANARPMMRVGCITFASPKVGFSLFRHVVNSLPNLKVIRLEHGQDAKCQAPSVGGWHVGHTLVLSGSIGQSAPKPQKAVLAYKFDTPKHKKFKTTHPDLRNYITTLEEMARLNLPWVKDFANTAGKGVVVNNEARQVV
jgi:hypothetical protein